MLSFISSFSFLTQLCEQRKWSFSALCCHSACDTATQTKHILPHNCHNCKKNMWKYHLVWWISWSNLGINSMKHGSILSYLNYFLCLLVSSKHCLSATANLRMYALCVCPPSSSGCLQYDNMACCISHSFDWQAWGLPQERKTRSHLCCWG